MVYSRLEKTSSLVKQDRQQQSFRAMEDQEREHLQISLTEIMLYPSWSDR